MLKENQKSEHFPNSQFIYSPFLLIRFCYNHRIRKVKDPYQEEEEEEEDQDTADDADVSTFLLSLMRNVTATSASIVG